MQYQCSAFVVGKSEPLYVKVALKAERLIRGPKSHKACGYRVNLSVIVDNRLVTYANRERQSPAIRCWSKGVAS